MEHKIVILCGKSSSGKDLIKNKLIKNGYKGIVTNTTRPPREGEQNGIHYNFLTEYHFLQLIKEGEMDSIVNYFDEMASIWDNAVSHNKVQIREIIKLSDINEGDKILDIGSGTGVLIDYIREVNKFGVIYEVDLSQKMLNMARAKNYNDANIRYLKQDIESYDINDKFDVIFFYNSFAYLKDKISALEHLAIENLYYGGRIVIFHNNGEEQINKSHACGDKRISNAFLPTFDSLIDSLNKSLFNISYSPFFFYIFS